MGEADSTSNSMVAQASAGDHTSTAREHETPSYSQRRESEEELQQIRAELLHEFEDLFQPVPPGLPPLREVNHTIPLIDESKRYSYHLPRCPEALRAQLSDKIQHYINAGWWEAQPVPQAAPMLCIRKKDGRLRTAVDL